MLDPSRWDLVRTLAALCEEPGPALQPLADALDMPLPTRADHTALFSFNAYPYASVYLGAQGHLGGAARDRIGGFWSAVGLQPPPEPDHLAALLGLWVTLSERAAHAVGAERVLRKRAAQACWDEHLAPWVFIWLDAVDRCEAASYEQWSHLLREILREGATEGEGHEPGQDVALHYRTAPDPFEPSGRSGDEAIQGLLAPVVTGMVVLRADLERLGARLRLVVRVAERAYALRGLLAQDAQGTLTGLAELAAEQARRCRAWPHSGAAAFWGPRAEATSERLREAAQAIEPRPSEVT